MDCTLEKECSALGGLFQSIINDLKNSHPVWDDFAQKATKLHVQLKSTISAVNFFLDALQKIADLATAAKGATRDIGTALTRICMRHRSVENRLKTLCSALIDCLVQPLQEKMEDWRRTAGQMDKDHAKEYKRYRHEIKKRSTDTSRLQKKLRKGQSNVQRMLESAAQEVNDRYLGLLDVERQAVRQAMIEQRSQYCLFVSWFKPVMDGEISLLNEISQMSEVVDLLCKHSADPYTLPPASEAVILDAKGLENTWRFQTPPSSPGSSSLGSRKSSYCSLSSSDSHNSTLHKQQQTACKNFQEKQQQSQQQHCQQIQHVQQPRHLPATLKHAENNKIPMNLRFSSMSSQDSGFTSQDTLFKKPKTPPKPLNLPSGTTQFIQPPTFNSDEDNDDEEGSTPNSLANSQQSTPSPSPSSATWPDGGAVGGIGTTVSRTSPPVTPPLQRPHTISSVYNDNRTTGNGGCGANRRMPLSSMTFVPPRPTSLFKNSPNLHNIAENACCLNVTAIENTKSIGHVTTPVAFSLLETPPGGHTVENQVRINCSAYQATTGSASAPAPSAAPSAFTPHIPDFNQQLPNQILIQPIYMNVADLHNQQHQQQFGMVQQLSPNIHTAAGDPRNHVILRTNLPRPPRRPLSFAGSADDCHLLLASTNQNCATPSMTSSTANSVQSRDDDEAGFLTPVATLMTNTIVRRPPPTGGAVSGKPPPPPIRRNSAITAATPTAPAIDVVRSNSRCTTPVEDSSYYQHSTANAFQSQQTMIHQQEQKQPLVINASTCAISRRSSVQSIGSASNNSTVLPAPVPVSAYVDPNAAHLVGHVTSLAGTGHSTMTSGHSASICGHLTTMTTRAKSEVPCSPSTTSSGYLDSQTANSSDSGHFYNQPSGHSNGQHISSGHLNGQRGQPSTMVSLNREVMLMQIRRGVRLRSTAESRNRSLPRV